MKRIALDIELLEDLVLSARAASAGAPETLDAIPGAVLLGAAARKLYAGLSSEQAFTLFHGGAVSFGSALPLAAAEVAWPVPRCWERVKDQDDWKQGAAPAPVHLVAERIYSRLFGVPADLQTKALRDAYVTASGAYVKVRRTLRLRTAIDPDTGRAADAQLFGYEAIEAGQRFRAVLSAETAEHHDLLERAADALCGIATLGRSRSAEYGRVAISRVDADPWPQTVAATDRVYLWLVSDLCLHNLANGQPLLIPDADALGLPAGKFVPEHSSLAVRTYAPWNGKRAGRDSDRQVICAGSVLCMEQVPPLDVETIAKLRHGIGLHREHGLGRIAVQPEILAHAHPRFTASPVSQADTMPVSPALSDYERNLLDWLSAGSAAAEIVSKAETRARDLFKKWRDLLNNARYFVSDAQQVGPSAQQWGCVRDLASQYDGADLRRALFEGDDAACKPTASGWGDTIDGNRGNHGSTLCAQFKKALGDAPDARMVAAFVREAQRHARDRSKQESHA